MFKKRKWVGCCRFVSVFPDINKVISFAERKLGTPYCSELNKFLTAKGRTDCYICSTITWRAFWEDDFDIHRLDARWMRTIAPSDIYLSDHVIQKAFINE